MKSLLTANRAGQLIQSMAGCPVLVAGDLMLDRFLWGSVDRISPEAPVPVVHLRSETVSLGGAGNVARNLRSMGAFPRLLGIVGDDRGAAELTSLLHDSGMSADGVLSLPGRVTTIKSRVIAHQQQVVRIDQESRKPLESSECRRLCSKASEFLADSRAVVISDYDKGLVTQELLEFLLPLAKASHLFVAIDPKPANYRHYQCASVVTPNLTEARSISGLRGISEAEIVEMGTVLLDRIKCEAVLLTRGEEGMTLFRTSSPPLHIPSWAHEVYDVTGAGDTVIAILALAMATGADVREASILANIAAGLVVGKLGTATVSPEEMMSAFDRFTEDVSQ